MTAEAHSAMDEQVGDDIVAVLEDQHQRVTVLLGAVKAAEGERRQELFDDLRRLLAVHETAEELVLRPVTKEIDHDVADARMEEEKQANAELAELEDLDVDSAEFEAKFSSFAAAVVEHAQNEQNQEFPRILSAKDTEERARLGRRLKKAESLAPTHPHPSTAGSTSAQMMAGPFVSMVDRVKDTMNGS